MRTAASLHQAARSSPSWVRAVTPSSKPISSIILPSLGLRTVTPVTCIHATYEMKRINHREAYSENGACTNQAESYISRLRRAEIGQHHRIAGLPWPICRRDGVARRHAPQRHRNPIQCMWPLGPEPSAITCLGGILATASSKAGASRHAVLQRKFQMKRQLVGPVERDQRRHGDQAAVAR